MALSKIDISKMTTGTTPVTQGYRINIRINS
jgi:hypothetical protein